MTLTGRIARKALPKPAADRLAFTVDRYQRYRNLRRDSSLLRQKAAACKSLEEQVDLIRSHQIFGAIQQRSEIIGLLELLRHDPPRYVCEIGTASGGTLFLLTKVCRPDALLLSVDLGLSFERCLIHARFASHKQRITSIRRDSRTPETLARVQSLLNGHPLDLLFIDGDHSYESVKADFANYRPLVRPGGLIVLHDIVPDYGTRHRKPTTNYTGGVPVFWQELKTKHKTSEFIEDHEQDGYGIGIIHN